MKRSRIRITPRFELLNTDVSKQSVFKSIYGLIVRPTSLMVLVFLFSIIGALGQFHVSNAAAGITKKFCSAVARETDYQSPYSQSPGLDKGSNLCLGENNGDDLEFFQFVVTLPGNGISDAIITASGGSGENLEKVSFVKVNNNTYVSTDGTSKGAGYQTDDTATSCNVGTSSNPSTKEVTITIQGVKQSVINLCNSPYYPPQSQGQNSLVPVSATGVTGDNGAAASTGEIEGYYCSIRDFPNGEAEGLWQKEGVTAFSITDTTTGVKKDAGNQPDGSSLFDITNGKLTVTGLKALDSYQISMTYNDAIVIQDTKFTDPAGYANYTSDSNSITIPDRPVQVEGSAITYITTGASTTKTPQCYNSTGKIATIQNTTNDNSVSCGSEVVGLGWLVCPIITGISTLDDGMWGLTSGLLKVNPLETSTTSGSIYTAWGTIRNVANVAFVIIFLIVIFSQLTSLGINNYGVKKMLPRLIVGAILVNLSFLIVQIGVDISNILGTSVYTVLIGLAPKITPSWVDLVSLLTTAAAGGVVAIAGIAIAGGAAAAFWMILPFVAIGALGLIAAFLTLVFRQAAIPILAILAPLAIVAYLLPNTESLFKKWRGLLISMLALYPLAALVFGGAQFAAATIINTNKDGQPNDWWSLLIGLIVLTLPLFSLPFLARQSGPIVGAVGGALQGLVQKARKPLTDVSRDFADTAKSKYMTDNPSSRNIGQRVRQRFDRARRGRELTRDSNKAKGDATWAGETISDAKLSQLTQAKLTSNAATGAANASHQAKFSSDLLASNGSAIVTALGAGGGNPEAAKAIAAAVTKATSEAVKEAELSANIAPGDLSAMASAFTSAVSRGDTITAQAMQNKMLTSGGPGIDMFRTATATAEAGGMSSEIKDSLRTNVLQNHAGLKASANDLTTWASDPDARSFSDVSDDKKTWEIADGDFARQHKTSQAKAMASGAVDKSQADRILNDKNLRQALAPEIRTQLETLAK
jgi:hypothetical protein